MQKRELSETKAENRKQQETTQLQRFENTFFNLMSLHDKILSDVKGRDFIAAFLLRSKDLEKVEYRSHNHYPILKSIYNSNVVLERFQSNINLYIASVARIAKYVTDGNLSKEDSHFYFSILDSNLSDNERTFIFYHVALTDKPTLATQTIRGLDKQNFFFKFLNPTYFHESHCILLSIVGNEKNIILGPNPISQSVPR